MMAIWTSVFMGWSLGANDSANTFGTAVSSRMVSFRLATFLVTVFAVAGAWFQGAAGMETLRGLTTHTARTAWMVTLAAALVMTLMTWLRLPASASQATVGALVGLGLAQNDVHWGGLGKVVACWIGTPIGAALACVGVYRLLAALVRVWKPSVFVYDPVMRAALLLCGCYSAYALGANNVANVSAMLAEGMGFSVRTAALFGGLTIGLGAVTGSRGVMRTVGRGIVKLDVFASLCTVLALALTVHVYAMIGVPVSTSQGIVGALIGIGVVKGMHVVNGKMFGRIALGWLSTPFLAGALTWALVRLSL